MCGKETDGRPNRIAEGIPVSHSITILYVQRKGSSGDFLKSWLITLIGRIDFVITGFMSGAIIFSNLDSAHVPWIRDTAALQ